ERGEAAGVAAVRINMALVRELPGEYRSTRRTAERIGHVIMRKREPVFHHVLHVRHVIEQIHREVVGEDEDDIRLSGRHARVGRRVVGGGAGGVGGGGVGGRRLAVFQGWGGGHARRRVRLRR